MPDASARLRTPSLFAPLILLLAGCNPCDYQIDTQDSSRKPLKTISGEFTEAQKAQIKADHEVSMARMKASMTAEQWAEYQAREERERVASQQRAKALVDGIANGTIQPRFRKATIAECSMHYSTSAGAWLVLLLLGAVPLHFVSKALTGRSLVSWLTGKKNA